MHRTLFEPDHELFRDSVRRFMQKEITPHVERWREQGQVDREAYLKAGAQGFLLMWAPEEYGGSDLADFRYEQILYEENLRHGDYGFYLQLHSRMVGNYLGKFANDEQKRRFLPGAASGEIILGVAMTEPGTGSDLANIQTRAEDKGDHWLLNGAKTYISNGLLGDLFVVAARTSASGDKPTFGLFLVERGMHGFERGNKLDKMGLHCQDTAELFFNDVKVPKANVLGDPTKGFAQLMQCLAEERLIIATCSIAHAQVAFDITLEFVQERKAFGQPIGTFQDARFKMADMRANLDAIQAFVDNCVMLHNDGRLSAELAAEAKYLATELEGRVLDSCVQLHGGAGYMNEYRICRMYTDARVTRIFGGTSEIMKEIIGRSLGLDDRKLK
ncbi:acyl-CoA dehydrogenase family protein [Stutzerimonas stutzeri]|uniref:acyl-CoA dehydrogenase family protein n=1 Tax=Stutzerimonas stutzeri TaxID=316 RepID=UPI00244CBEEC|nr:acyl-CoA dehydrogenase family protein [Stutzerimonas stutzeri]MDH0425437.1 acyl-CoA dehydrogenase family protein [Stutzerimonas stutzeri]